MLKNIATALKLAYACIFVWLHSRRRIAKNGKTGSSERETTSSDNFYSVRCEPGVVERQGDGKTSSVDDNGYEVIGLPTLTQQTSAESRPRIARRPPLPIDRRSLSMQSGGVGGGTGLVERPRVAVSRYGSRSTVSSVNGVDADVRQLIDEVRRRVSIRGLVCSCSTMLHDLIRIWKLGGPHFRAFPHSLFFLRFSSFRGFLIREKFLNSYIAVGRAIWWNKTDFLPMVFRRRSNVKCEFWITALSRLSFV